MMQKPTYGCWFYHELLPFLGTNQPRFDLETATCGTFQVTASSTRLECLKRNPQCVSCKRRGEVWLLQSHGRLGRKAEQRPHLNLYAVTKGGLLLMTQDHILAKANGGGDALSNLQTMCSKCNNEKGSMMPDEYTRRFGRPQKLDGRGASSKGLQTVSQYADEFCFYIARAS